MKKIYTGALIFLLGLHLSAQTNFDTGRNTSATVYEFNEGWTNGDPSGMATAIDEIHIISGNAFITSNTNIDKVTIAPSAALTINSSVSLTAKKVSLESTSTQYPSLISYDNISKAEFEYKLHVNGTVKTGVTTGGNDLISAPLTGQPFKDFQSANDNIVSNTSKTSFLFGPLDKTNGSFLLYANDERAPLDPGMGYRAAATGENGGTFTFTGTVNTGDISTTITNSGTHFKTWNLIGNPYPTYLSVKDFLQYVVYTDTATGKETKNIDLMDSNSRGIYGYTGDASNYKIYNLLTIDANTLIAPGQGFYVSADATMAAAHDIVFTPEMRRTGSSDDFISNRSDADNKFLQLTISKADDSYNTEFYFNENATLGLDPGYDAALFGDGTPAFSIYSQLVEDNEGRNMAIQCLGMTDMDDVTVSLGVNAPRAQQTSISINKSSLPSTIDVYLDDILTNTHTKLNTGDYTFTPDTDLSGTGRFFLRFSNNTLSTSTETLNTVQVYTLNDSILIKGRLAHNSKFMLYDVQGRLVLETALNQDAISQHVDVSSMSSGIYIVKISNAELQKTQKLIIN